MGRSKVHYYYAGGERVSLEPDREHVALQRGVASGTARRSRGTGAPAAEAGRRLNDDVVLLPAEALKAGSGARGRGAAAEAGMSETKLPVFRSGSALVVALPEVRVEDTDPGHLERLRKWLAADPDRAEVVSEQPGRLTLRAGAALAHDGVALARAVVERCGVVSASPRLLRVLPAPKR